MQTRELDFPATPPHPYIPLPKALGSDHRRTREGEGRGELCAKSRRARSDMTQLTAKANGKKNMSGAELQVAFALCASRLRTRAAHA